MKKINKKMTFMEIMQKSPEAAEILMKEGLHCIGCGMAAYETLEQGALAHGLDADKLVEKIQKILDKSSGSRTKEVSSEINKKINKEKKK